MEILELIAGRRVTQDASAPLGDQVCIHQCLIAVAHGLKEGVGGIHWRLGGDCGCGTAAAAGDEYRRQNRDCYPGPAELCPPSATRRRPVFFHAEDYAARPDGSRTAPATSRTFPIHSLAAALSGAPRHTNRRQAG